MDTDSTLRNDGSIEPTTQQSSDESYIRLQLDSIYQKMVCVLMHSVVLVAVVAAETTA